MNFKRIFSLLLAVMMLSSCFLFGCDGTAKDTQQGTVGGFDPGDTADTSKIYDAPIRDLGGHEFLFSVKKTSSIQTASHEFYAEDLNGEKINDAVFTRNSQLMEKYNCVIKENQMKDPAANLKDPLLAGDYVCDYIYDATRNFPNLAVSNLLVDLSVLENINLKKAWYDQSTMPKINMGGKSFYVQGDGIIGDDKSAWIVYFNKELVSAFDSDLNLYQKVREGEWTLELMYQIMEGTKNDLNGDGAFTIGSDRFGLIAERATNWMFVNACNVTVSVIADDGSYTLPDSPKPELIDAWTALKPVLTSPYREVSSKIANYKNAMGTFYAGNAGILFEMGDVTFDYGVLPMPKLNKDQANYCTGVMASQFNSIVIPSTVNSANNDWAKNGFSSGAEQAAYFLEAYFYYSMNVLTPAFYDQVVLKQSIVDEDSREMIIIALEHKVFDFICTMNFGGMNLFATVGSENKNNIVGTDALYDTLVSEYESRVGAARTEFQAYLDGVAASGQ